MTGNRQTLGHTGYFAECRSYRVSRVDFFEIPSMSVN